MSLEKFLERKNIAVEQPKDPDDFNMLMTEEHDTIIEEVAELEAPIKKIIEKLGARIERGEYGLIIGDDASGRIPARILGGFIKKISKLRGVRDPNIIFIPGKLRSKQFDPMAENLQKHMFSHGAREGDRVLIVTEAIMSGESFQVLYELLTEAGFKVDIATMGVEKSKNIRFFFKRRKNLGDSKIISGDYYGHSPKLLNTPSVFKDKELSGVYKLPGDLKSKPMKFIDNHYRPGVQTKINESRNQADTLVDELVTWYEGQNKQK